MQGTLRVMKFNPTRARPALSSAETLLLPCDAPCALPGTRQLPLPPQSPCCCVLSSGACWVLLGSPALEKVLPHGLRGNQAWAHLVSDLPPPHRSRAKFCCFKPLSVWYFLTAAPRNSDTYLVWISHINGGYTVRSFGSGSFHLS